VKAREGVAVAVLAGLCAVLALLPSPRRIADDAISSRRARIIATDDSLLQLTGLVEYGTQVLTVEVLDGPGKGRTFRAENELRAQLDIDKKFKPGDTAVVIWPEGDVPPDTTLVVRDHFRLGWGLALFAAFAVLLVAFGGWTGAKALFSFAFSCFAVWKLLVPLCLSGWDAAWTSFGVVTVLTAVIIGLVAGVTRRGFVAFTGSMLGIAISLLLAGGVAAAMHVTGVTMPYVQALLYSGYAELDLSDIFCGAVILASSGAVMDLAMDIATGLEEVHRHNPTLGRRALFASGLRMGRAVVGTMTTTLLLAYSGGCLTLLMVFAAQGTPPLDFLNSTLVSAEVVKTLVGSFGLVLVAPFTALVGALVICRTSGMENPNAVSTGGDHA